MGSVRGSGNLLSLGSQNAAREFGLLLALVSVQSNSSGSFAWLYDYGWQQGALSAAYVNGSTVNWSSNCSGVLEPGGVCAILIPPGNHGQVTLVFGTKSLEYTI